MTRIHNGSKGWHPHIPPMLSLDSGDPWPWPHILRLDHVLDNRPRNQAAPAPSNKKDQDNEEA